MLFYGKIVDDGNGLGFVVDYESCGIVYFCMINDNFKLVVELNCYWIDGCDGVVFDEDIDIVVFGVVLNW